MYTVAVMSFKGGVGKTTTTTHLAAATFERGLRTLVIDLDFQGSAAMDISGKRYSRGAGEWLMRDEVEIDDVRVRLKEGGEALIDLIPGDRALTYADVMLRTSASKTRLLSRMLSAERRNSYDLVLIDTSPAANMLAYNAAYAADMILCPFELKYSAFVGPETLIHELKALGAQEHPPRDFDIYLLPTAYDRRNGSHSEAHLNTAVEVFGRYPDGLVLPPVSYSVSIANAPEQQQTMFEYRPDHQIVQDYRRILDIIQEISYAEEG